MSDTENSRLRGVLAFVGIVWAAFIADVILPVDFTAWGIVPRSLKGLIGIPIAPFVHGGWGHLISNTVPLIILLVLLATSRPRPLEIVFEITLAAGAMLWAFGRNGSSAQVVSHVGASGLIYGLIAYLIVAGFREAKPVPLVVSILVGLLYGTTLLTGVLPTVDSQVSWDGHLLGAIGGGLLAFFTLGKASSDAGDASPIA